MRRKMNAGAPWFPATTGMPITSCGSYVDHLVAMIKIFIVVELIFQFFLASKSTKISSTILNN